MPCSFLEQGGRWGSKKAINLEISTGMANLREKLLSFSLSVVSDRWTAACQASLSFTISQSLLKLMSLESVMPSNHLILCQPLLFLPSIFPSIRVFSNKSALCISWLKYWSFSISPSNEYSWLISVRIDWFDLLAVQGILRSLLQHHSSKASLIWCSAFFLVQLSHPYMTSGKTIALTIQPFVSKMMSLLLYWSLAAFKWYEFFNAHIMLALEDVAQGRPFPRAESGSM